MDEAFDPRRPYLLDNSVQGYDWGSTTAIPELLGRPNPAEEPQAELWMGAHPKAPSKVLVDGRRVSLTDLVERTPEPILGREVLSRFGARLPFLFKVLAAARALSIQAHPNLEQARSGFQRENEAGIPQDAPERNYIDDNHKPEILCALSDFWGMRGFRPIGDIRADLNQFDNNELAEVASLFVGRPPSDSLARFLKRLLELEPEAARAVVENAVRRSESLEGDRFRWIERLAEQYPGDIGAVAPLFLNVVHLKSGEAIYQKAGELHAYLEGTGIELMANSDNVLRGGLTTKHIDVAELMRVLAFEASAAKVIMSRRGTDGAEVYDTPIDEFRLSRIEASRSAGYSAQAIRSVEILLCVLGEGLCTWPGETGGSLPFAKGQSLLVPAVVPGYSISGEAVLFRADVPLSSAFKRGKGSENLG